MPAIAHVRAWYWYAFAAEVFSACALAIFLPITLEQMAREIGFKSHDHTKPCKDAVPIPGQDPGQCKALILGVWVDTASFSMYVKSTAVLLQALSIISIGTLADTLYWRKRLLFAFAFVGSGTASIFLFLPGTPGAALPVIAGVITLVGNVCYAASIVCANAFLPGLAREDAAVKDAQVLEVEEGAVVVSEGEREREEPQARESLEVEAQALLTAPGSKADAEAAYNTLLSRTVGRLSSTGTAIGFASGVTMLALLSVPVTIGKGSTRSLMLAVGLSGAWWAVFSIPAAVGLPGGRREPAPHRWLSTAWRKVGGMVRPARMRELPNLFTYLLAWIFLSDGFHTTTYTAILYASSHLHMSPTKIIVIGLLVQLFAVLSSIYAPRLQRRFGWSNLSLLIHIVIAAQALPIYTCLGLILPFGGLRTEGEMYGAAIWFGLLYGPFNSYARAVYAELIPPGHESTFFSLFSLTDKSASFVGPAIVGLISDLTGNIRFGFLFLLAMLAIPVPVLLRVRMRKGAEEAAVWAAGAVSEQEQEH